MRSWLCSNRPSPPLDRCRAHSDIGINLPWAFYGAGRLDLLIGRPYDSLHAFARAVSASTAAFMIEGALESIRRLKVVADELIGRDWVLRMLVLGLAAKFESAAATAQLRKLSSAHPAIEGPVVMVVGGTHPSVEERMEEYRPLVLEAFRDFRGTLVCGGTTQGISGLVGEVGERYGERVHLLAYVPETLPADATLDERYEIRRTTGSAFTPMEPLQSWIDLMVSGVRPQEVKVLGINGGEVAAAEFRIALALGAAVGVVHGSGREAGRLLAEAEWTVPEKLLALPSDPQTARAFVGSGASRLDSTARAAVGRAIHEAHRRDAAVRLPDWDDLPDDLKESSQLQADHIFEKLRQIGCDVRPVTDRAIALMTFSDEEVKTLAEMEHGRWTAERLSSGWKWGEEKSLEKKISPYLVAWSDLPEEQREWDRSTVRRVPHFLAAVGLEIYRESDARP